MSNTCANCKHFRQTVHTKKDWGKCENEKNEVKMAASALVHKYVEDDWAKDEILDGIRYPADFGCIFFEPITTKA